MATPRHPDGTVLVLVGTTKGAFILSSDPARERWTVDGPHFPGESVYAIAYDQRGGRTRTMVATQHGHFGATIRISDDHGATWTGPERQAVRFPESSGLALAQVWQIAPGYADEPDVTWCGVEPAALFRSDDAGESWQPVEGLLAHEHRERWMPGGGGLCLHTIVRDPANRQRMGVAISTAGFYRTDDGGATWQARNAGVRAVFLPNQHPEFGQCVHKVVSHPSRPERLFLQNHWGLYRSDDWGDSWQDVANGVPSDFGFAMQMHPHDPDTVYIIPIESDAFRVVAGSKLRVYRTQDAGASWHPLARGFPEGDAYECVLRDGLAADSHDPAGVYFGTRGGRLFASATAGDDWREIAEALPPDLLREGGGRRLGVSAAAVSVVLPQVLSAYAEGNATVRVEAPCATVAEALASVATRWPAVTDRILTEQGALRRHVNLFVGEENVRYTGGLDTTLASGATITVVAAVSGG